MGPHSCGGHCVHVLLPHPPPHASPQCGGVKQPQSLPIAPEPPLTAQTRPAGQMQNATAPSESVTATVAWKVTVSVAPATG